MSIMRVFRAVTVYLGDAAISQTHRKDIERYMLSAGITVSPQYLFGLLCHLTVLLSIVASALLTYTLRGAPVVTKVVVSILVLPFFMFLFLLLGVKIFQLYVDTRRYGRVGEMEDVLPEFLAEVSLNIKAGRSLQDALALAAREDFGILSEEMERLATRVSLGFDLGEAIKEFNRSFPSDVIGESLQLIYTSWRKGARTPQLIDRIVANLKLTRHLREKVSASVASYQIFLATVTLVITPAMFALAYHFLTLVRSITSQVQTTTAGVVLPISIATIAFNEAEFLWFSGITVVVIAVSSCMIISYTVSGSVKSAWKQMILYTALSLGSYALFLAIFGAYFGFLTP